MKLLEIGLEKFKELFKKPEIWMVIVMSYQAYVMFGQEKVMKQQKRVMEQQKEIAKKQTKIMSYSLLKKVPKVGLKATEHGILLLLKSYSDVPLYVEPQFKPILLKEEEEKREEYTLALTLLMKSLQQGCSLFSNLIGNIFVLNPKEEKEIPFMSNSFLRNLCREPTSPLCKYLKTYKELKLLIILRLRFRPVHDKKKEATNSATYLLTIENKNKPFPYTKVQHLNSMQLLEIDEQYHLAKFVRLYNCLDK